MNRNFLHKAAIALFVLAAFAYGMYSWGQRTERMENVKQAEAEVSRQVDVVSENLLSAIKERDKALAAQEAEKARLRKDYADLAERRRLAAAKATEIKLPASEAETRDRMSRLGYNTK